MKTLHHFYHVYADGDWLNILENHINYLIDYDIYNNLDTFQIGIVGNKNNIQQVKSFLFNKNIKYIICNEQESGFEQVTLNKLYEFSLINDGYVFYAHTKGANSGKLNTDSNIHRECMSFYNIKYWRRIIQILETYNLVGCYFVEYQCNCEINHNIMHKNLNGNFWWIKLKDLRKGNYPGNENRWRAEHFAPDLSYIIQDYKIYDIRYNSDPIFDIENYKIYNKHEDVYF